MGIAVIDFLAVTICVGDFLYQEYADLALKAQRKYWGHFGIPFEVCTEHFEEMRGTSPSWQRVVMHEHYDAKFILIHGLDMLPCNLKYDIRDFLMVDYVNMATDCSVIGCDPELHRYPHFRYNADMIGYPRTMAQFFRGVWNKYRDDPKYKDTFEQYCLNRELYEQRVYVNEIPNCFNRFYYPGIDYSRTAFCHYTNYMGSHNKTEYIVNHHPKEMIE
jgi:hypothetical protein